MKTEILKVVEDSIITFGEERKFVVVAATHKVDKIKFYGIGFAICNPQDNFNLEIGTKIATNKALDPNNPLYSAINCNAFITPVMIDTLIKQEIAYFKKNPAAHLPGYQKLAEKKLKEEVKHQAVKDLINNYGDSLQELLNLPNDKKQLVIKLLNES